MVEPFLAYYLTGVRGLSLAVTGAVLAMSGAGSVVSQLVAGTRLLALGAPVLWVSCAGLSALAAAAHRAPPLR
jgi:hypothetical protein